MTPIELLIAAVVTLIGATIAGITGYGSGLTLLPVLTFFLGPKIAIPLVAFVQLTTNSSLVVLHRTKIGWKYGIWYGVGSLPGAAIGVYLFSIFSPAALTGVVGAFVLSIPLLRRCFKKEYKIAPWMFFWVGLFTGIISGFIGIYGPITAPFFLALGLTKGAFVGTEALGAIFVHTTKIIGYALTRILTLEIFLYGCILAPIAWLGAWIGRKCHERMKDYQFGLSLDAICLFFGILLIIRSFL